MTTAYQALNQTGGLQAVQPATNNWLDPGVTSWTSTYAPGQVYENEGLGAMMLRPQILDYLSQAGLSGDGLSMSVDKNGNPFTWNGYIMPASVTDPLTDKGYADYLATYAGDRGTDKLANFLNEKNWGLRVGNNGTTYINQLYDKGTNQGLAADVRDERGSWLQQNGWMIPLAALGGIAAAGPTALGEGAVGMGSTASGITGGGISAGGGGLLGGTGTVGGLGESGLSPINAADLSSLPQVPLDPWTAPTLPGLAEGVAGSGGIKTIAELGGEALKPITQGPLAPQVTDLAPWTPPSLPPVPPVPSGLPNVPNVPGSKGLIDSLTDVGKVAAPIIGAVAGAASGGGTNTATSQSKTDPRLDPYIYGDQGYLKALQNKYNANPSGINPLMQQALDIGTANLTDPQYAQTYQNMRNFGNGLLSQPLAGNPFTNGQGGQVQGLLSNFGGRAQSMIGQGGGLLGNSRQNQMQQPVTTGDGAHHMMAIRGGYVKG